MKSNDLELRTIFPTGLICGLLGGGGLVLVSIMPIKGWWVIPVYVVAMHATMLALKFNRKIEVTYAKAFLTGVLTFMLMTFILYFYIMNFGNPASDITFYGHALRVLVMFGIAMISSAILSLFFLKRKHNVQTIES